MRRPELPAAIALALSALAGLGLVAVYVAGGLVVLLMLAMGAGFTGYSLPYDLLSGTGVRIAHSILLSVPVVGTWAAFLAFGGEFPAPDIVGRLHAMHIFMLPAAITAFLALHLAILWHQKHTQFRGPGRTEGNVVGSPLWPNYMMKGAGVAFVVFGVVALLGGVAQIAPVWIQGPFDATLVTSPAQPDWYLGWVEGALRITPAFELVLFGRTIPEVFFPAVLMPLVFFAVMFLWPFIERRISGDREPHHLLDRARDVPWRTGAGAGIVTFAGILTLAGSNDVISVYLRVPVESVTIAFRFLVLALPPVAGYLTYRVCRSLRDRELAGTRGRPWRGRAGDG